MRKRILKKQNKIKSDVDIWKEKENEEDVGYKKVEEEEKNWNKQIMYETWFWRIVIRKIKNILNEGIK